MATTLDPTAKRGDYFIGELEDSLRQAFVVGKADFVFIDSRRQRFLIAAANLGLEQGWLTEQFLQLDDQCSQLRYRLTDAGRAHFGLLP